MQTPYIKALEDGFRDELLKIAACQRENAHKRERHTKTRAGRRPIRADKLVKSAQGLPAMAAPAANLAKDPKVLTLLAGLTGGFMGHQALQDWQMGRKVRAAQRGR